MERFLEQAFLTVLNMSITAAWIIPVILLIRLLLRRAPKKYSYALWSVVAFRLCCPISFRSAISALGALELKPTPPAETTVGLSAPALSQAVNAMDYVPQDIGFAAQPEVHVGSEAISEAINQVLPAATPMYSMNPIQFWIFIGMAVWCLGIAVLLLYSLVTWLGLKYQLRTAVRLRDNVWQSEYVRSPFILGLLRPKIYVPYGLEEPQLQCVLAHETYHLRKGDHIVKPLAFLLLTVHWFNPLCWLAFFLMGNDMEMRCDEAVLQKENVKAYSTLLLSFAANRRFQVAGPLAFGERGAKGRIRNALRWKKPGRAVTVCAVILVLAALLACAANPRARSSASETEIVTYYCTGSNYDVLQAEISRWNAGEGAEKGVELRLESPCNCPMTMEEHLKQGESWDLFDGGNDQTLVAGGWVKNLETVESEEVRALLENCRSDMGEGVCYLEGITVGVPGERIPLKLAVNLELFEKNGLTLPETWADVVNAARTVTENGGGTEFGWGACTWNRYLSRMVLLGSAGEPWWDPEARAFHFAQYEKVMGAMAQMYADGSMLGMDDMSLDEIRERFASGCVAMIPAASYDYAAYTLQFPVEFRWTIIDMPVSSSGASGAYLTRVGPSICAPAYEGGTESHRRAVEAAWLFLNGDGMQEALCLQERIIPRNGVSGDGAASSEAWRGLTDTENYVPAYEPPEAIQAMEAGGADAVLRAVIRGETAWSQELAMELASRCNAALE